MTEREKIELQEAFHIPEPERKREFTARYKELQKAQKKRPIFPAVMRFAAAAAMCAVIVGTWANIKDNAKPMDNGVDTVTVTEAQETETADTSVKGEDTATETTAVNTTASKTTKKSGTSTTSSAVTTTDKASVSSKAASVNNADDPETATQSEDRETSKNTEKSDAPTTTRSAEKTTKTTTKTTPNTTTTKTTTKATATKTTTAKAETITTTTYKMDTSKDNAVTKAGDDGNGGGVPSPAVPANGGGEDYRVDTGIRIYPNGNVIDINDYINHGIGGGGYNPYAFDLDDLLNSSDSVFLGTVEEVIYTYADDMSMVQLNVKVNSSFKGSFGIGDRISVFYGGGYMSAKEYMEKRGYGFEVPEGSYIDMGGSNYFHEGTEYIFFTQNDDDIGKHAQRTTKAGDDSIFILDGSNCYDIFGNYKFNIYQLK